MKKQVSNYEVILPLDDEDHFLLLNGLYGAYDVVDKKVGAVLLSGDIDAIPMEEQERLLARGHLCDRHETEKEDLSLIAQVYRKLVREKLLCITLIPTYDCNFRCPYCFEKHRLSCGEEWLKKTMSTEMVDAVFEAIEKEKKRGSRIDRMRIYGGEPLLKENKEIIRYISKKAVDAGLTLDVTTNGYDLDQFIDVLTEYNYSLVFTTLDGTGEDNDKRRVYAGGGGSFEKIINNVGLALSKGLRVSVRINVGPENLDRASDLAEVFEEKGFTGYPGFVYYYTATNGENYPGEDHGVSFRELVKMQTRKGLEKNYAMEHVFRYAFDVYWMRSLIKDKEYYKTTDTACGAETNSLKIDPEGYIYTCTKLVAREDMRVGRVDVEKGKFAYTFDLLKWNNRSVMNLPECMECPYVFICRGGCAYEAYLEKGDISKHCCGQNKEIINDSAIEVCSEIFKKTGERELTKSLKELINSLAPEEKKKLFFAARKG